MQLTLHTDYSLRTLLYLQALAEDEIATINEIADFYDISRNHLMKVVFHLSQKGYIKSIRGKGGGIKLAKKAEDITVGQVVRDMEPNLHIVECFNKESENKCSIVSNCGLIPVLHEATSLFMSVLDKYTLDSLVQKAPEWLPIQIQRRK